MNLLGDIKSPRLIVWKGFLFLLCGLLAAGGLVAQNPSLTTIALLAIAVWAFCRWYYFMFYVIEHYVDPRFKFAGLGSAVRYLARRGPESEEARRKGGPV